MRNKVSDSRLISRVVTLKLCVGFDAGPVPDMGPYPINACRNIFGLEPIEVMAVGFKSAGRGYLQMEHDTISVTLRFSGDRLAQFVVGYATAGSEGFKVVGTTGNASFERVRHPI